MSNAGWHFKRRERSDEVADPIQGEFFDEASDPDERRRGPAASLIREAIQNSLDARAGNDRVHVRFYLSGEQGLPAERARSWFGRLWPHLGANRSGIRSVAREPQACRFVVVEDFGTTGLEGDPMRGETPDEDERNEHFFAFFRANGLSGKAGGEGGRWGVGKSVFNRASRINSFLALSVRHSDRCAHLIGRCFLLTHKINGIEYQPYGRYGVLECDDDFVLPVEDSEVINVLRHDFRIARELDTPGLSVVVPYADEEITVDAMRSAVIREYFWPILSGRLSVSIAGPGAKPTTLNADTLLQCAEDEDRLALTNELRSLIQFAIHAQTLPESSFVHLRDPGHPPNWTDTLFPTDMMRKLCTRYVHGELLAFQIPVLVRETQGAEQGSHFLVYVRLDRDGRGYVPVFVRSGLIIPRARERRVRGHSVHAVVVIEDRGLSSMLGDAETPAHTDWSPDSRNFRDKYDHGRATIDFVKSAPVRIVEILSRAQEERDWLALADFFPAPPEDDGLPEEDSGTDSGTETDQPEPPPQRSPQPYRIEHVVGGFRIVRDNPSETRLPPALRISVAYDTTRGNPLKRYHPADFDVSKPPIRTEVAAARIAEHGGNVLLVQLDDDSFRIEVHGFDRNRDLYVRAEPTEDDEVPGGQNEEVDEALGAQA